MVNEIHIQNFRCFEDTWVSGFRNINLIGGLNNSGKTALLEAIELSQDSNHYPLYSMRNHEMENDEDYAKGLALDYTKPVEVTTINSYTNSESDERKVRLTIKEQDTQIEQCEWHYEEIGGVRWGFSRWDSDRTDAQNEGRFTYKSLITYSNQDDRNISETLDKTKWILYAVELKVDAIATELFKSYLTRLNEKYVDFTCGYEGEFCNVFYFNIVTSDNQVIPYYQLSKGEQSLLCIFARLATFSFPNHYFLIIDDIDLHIDFTKMDLLWTILFEYIEEYPGFQVFSATHNLEMIESFSRIANKLGQDKAMYFRMGKQQLKTRLRIISSPSTPELLEDNLEYLNLKPRQPFRGE